MIWFFCAVVLVLWFIDDHWADIKVMLYHRENLVGENQELRAALRSVKEDFCDDCLQGRFVDGDDVDYDNLWKAAQEASDTCAIALGDSYK